MASEDLPPPLNKVACDDGAEGAAQFQWARPPQQAAVKERAEATVAVPEPQSLADIERQAIEEAIERCNGNITQAANLLEVSPSTIYRKMQAWQQA